MAENNEQKSFLDIPGLSHLWAGLKTKMAKKDLSNVDPTTGRESLGIINPDWGQNDTEAVDFVKNRTHWIEDLIVPYAQYAVDATYHRAIIEQGGLRAGENYTVTWEGTEYVCTATYQNVLYTVLGDDGVVPFKIQSSSSRMYIYPTDTTLTSVNMGIKGPGAYHPLSENFLPVVPIEKGGFGGTTVSEAQETLGIGGKRTTRLTIGTSTSGWAAKDCDYLCDGEADDVEINAAIDALPEEGGEIVLLDGSYYLTDDIDLGTAGVTIRGNGQATKLVRAADGVSMLYIRYPGCTVENLYLDGQIEAYTGSSNSGIYVGSDNNIIRGCTITGNTSYGIQCWGAHNMISENTISNSYTGINVLDDYNVVSNNVALSNSEHGINVNGDHNTVTGNISRLNAVANLRLTAANHCVVVGNDFSITADDEVTAQYAVYLYGTSNTYNTVTENLLGSGSITDDGGTGNITGYRPNTWMPTASDVGAAKSSHNHAASNITSGTLSTDRLPTVPFEKGGLGGTDRLSSAKNLTNESISSPGYVVSLTGSWANFGYTTLAQLRTAMGVASATPSVSSANNSFHYAYLAKIGKLVICTLMPKGVTSQAIYEETITIPAGYRPSANKSFTFYSDTAKNAGSSNGLVTVSVATGGALKVSSTYGVSVREASQTYCWATA